VHCIDIFEIEHLPVIRERSGAVTLGEALGAVPGIRVDVANSRYVDARLLQ
jgi:hypothetical protein